MITPYTSQLALYTYNWLERRGCVCSLMKYQSEFHLHYTLAEDIKPQPALIIRDKSVIFPKGSQEDVLNAFYRGTT